MAAELPAIVSTSTVLYRALLGLYPRAHRREYGPLMAQAFRDLCRDAYARGRSRAVLRLWLCALIDLAQAAVREHLAGLAQGGTPMIENRPVRPLPWWEVVLAVLPGLAVLAGTGPGADALGQLAGWLPGGLPFSVRAIPILTLAVAGLLIVVALIRRRRFPTWGLPALGVAFGLALAQPGLAFVAALGLLAAVVYLGVRGQDLERLPRWSWALLAGAVALAFLPALGTALSGPFGAVNWWSLMGVVATLGVIALGAPLAQRYGLATGLAVAGAGYALWTETFDLSYGLAHTYWAGAMLAVLALFLLVAAPIWVLLARSTHGQAWGLLAPAGVALGCVAAVNALVRTDPTPLLSFISHRLPLASALDFGLGISYGSLGRAATVVRLLRDGTQVLQLLLVLALAVVAYARLG
ncbi:MAG: hypothetical protein QME94_18445, partial [Anaerolineae bacterium]|nr:hypothetical protein [Anaerolineae bacterium]